MSEHSPSQRVRSFRVEAVVLRHNDWGEADRLVSLFSLELGKIRTLAKGVRKPRSRKAGHLEPFTRASLLLARGREILLITQADTLQAYSALRTDLMLTTYAAYVIELLDRFTFEEGENRSLYYLLVDTLNRLENISPGDAPIGNPSKLEAVETDPTYNADLVVRYFEIRLLDLVGFRPQLFHCTNCGNKIQPEDQFFSAESGGILCPKCGPRSAGAARISVQALKYLRHYQRSNFDDAGRARPTTLVNRELEGLMQHYLTYLLERGLNTPAFLRRLRQEKANNPL